MNITITQPELLQALKTVEKAVTSKTTIPALACVLLSAGEQLKLSATNLEFDIICFAGAKVGKTGAVAVPAKALVEYVSTLDGEINLTYSEKTAKLSIVNGSTKTNIKCLPADEFPKIGGQLEYVGSIDGQELKSMISRTLFCASTENNRPILNAVHISLVGTKLSVTGADGFRLATTSAYIAGEVKPFSAIVQVKAAAELARILVAGQCKLYKSENSFRVVMSNDAEFSCQLVAGNYPDIVQLIPKNNPTMVSVKTADILKAMKQAEIFARDGSGIVRLDVAENSIGLRSNSSETGEYETEVLAEVNGPSLAIAVNSAYVREVVNAVVPEMVQLAMNTKSSPICISPAGDDSTLYLVMPMQLDNQE